MRRVGAGPADGRPALSDETHMRMRTRKLVGTIVLMVFLAVYAFAAMLVAIVLQVSGNKLAEPVFYLVAGMAWVVPAAIIVRWMQRPDATDE